MYRKRDFSLAMRKHSGVPKNLRGYKTTQTIAVIVCDGIFAKKSTEKEEMYCPHRA